MASIFLQLRTADLVVAHGHEVIQPLPQDPLRQLERRARREGLGEGLRPIVDQPPLAP